jgi:hypothetical protein
MGSFRDLIAWQRASGSTSELETQIEFAMRSQLISRAIGLELLRRSEEVGRLISGLLRRPKDLTHPYSNAIIPSRSNR